eukprot:366229-Chlamydomonas_euryale.AAC.62
MPGKPPALSPKDIVDFIFLPVINEGCRVVAEGIVDKPEDLDVASVMSFGFPAYRVGYAVPRERAGGCAGLRADIASDAAWWTIKAEFSPQQKCALCTPRVSGTVFAREKVS